MELAELTQKLYDHPYTVTNATKTIETHLVAMHRSMKDVALAKNANEIQAAVQKVNTSEIIIYKEFNIIFDRYLGDKKDIVQSYDAFVSWKLIRDEVISLMQADKKEQAAAITKGKGAKHLENLFKQVHKMVMYAQNKAIFFQQNTLKSKTKSIIVIISMLAIILLIIITILILLIKNFSKTDKELKKHLHLIDQNIMSATMNLDFKVIDASNALVRHIGMTKDKLINTPNLFLFNECDESEITQLQKMTKTGKDWQGEIKKLGYNGEIKWLFLQIHPIFDDLYNVTGYANIFTDISSKKEIEEMSKLDGLTNIYNRYFFDKIFPVQIKIASRQHLLLTFVMLDIDHFKQYNDTYGHQAGDDALKMIAMTLKEIMKRPNDYTFRLGGEEFGMLYMTNEIKDGLKLANLARENIENLKIPHTLNSASEFVTISMGVYVIKPENASNVDEIYRLTDEALYKAKEGGRNKIVQIDI